MAKTKRPRHNYTREQEQELLDAVKDPKQPISRILKDFAKRWKIKPATLNSKLIRLRNHGPSAEPVSTGPSSRQKDPDLSADNCIRVSIKSFSIQQQGDKMELVMKLK